MKKAIILLFVISLFAECPPVDPCMPTNCAYLPASKKCIFQNICLENSDFYCFFDFLWWEGTEKGLEFASKNGKSFFDQDIKLYEPEFEFNPAFRLGIGYHLPYDEWDIEFNYTRYSTHTINHANHNNISNPNGGIRSIWTSAAAFQESGFLTLWQDTEAKWKLRANLFDLFLKHRLCLSPALTVEPTFGLKLALFQQRYKILYQNGNTAPANFGPIQFLSSNVAMKNRSFNLGPSVSVLTRWNLWDHYDFLGSLSGSLLATRFTVGRNEFDVSFTNALQLDSIRQRNTFWNLRPQTAASLGLGWSDCICKPNKVIYYGFSATYEAQVYWKQNMLYRFIDQTNAAMIVPTQGDLFFHGLTVDAFIDF